MIGTNTALLDDPVLTARLWPGNNPVRMVIDMQLKLPSSLKLFDGSVKTIVFNQIKQEEGGTVAYYKIEKDSSLVPQVLNALHQLRIQSVMIEGGAKLLQSFIDAGLWDEARVIKNRRLAVGTEQGVDAPVLEKAELIETQEIETDIINTYQPQH